MMAPYVCVRVFLQDGEEPDKMPEWLLEEKRDFEEHLDVAPSEGKFREEEVTHLFKHTDLNQVSSAVILCTNDLVNLEK